MAKWLFASLGGSDIQFAADVDKKPEERRIKDYYNDCRDLYYLLKETGDTKEIIAPILQTLVQELVEQGTPPDKMLLFYTDQRREQPDVDVPGLDKDTYWAYQIIKFLAEETDFFGIRLEVEGVYVRGNPASFEEMVYLYKQVMTADSLKALGVHEDDEIYACFTAGTPAMSHYLMLGFSSLHMPKRRECYAAHMKKRITTAHRIPLVELMRYDDVVGVLKELLRSRQFPEASRLIESTRFSLLEEHERNLAIWIRVLHQRYLFCFDDALNLTEQCSPSFRQEPFVANMQQDLRVLKKGMEKYERFTAEHAKETTIKMLIVEYFHKVMFFWNSKQWNEFAFIASSFYEWLLQLAFYDAIGFSFASGNQDKKRWYNYLLERKENPKFPEWLQLQVDKEIKSDRLLYLHVLKQSPDWSKFAQSDWRQKMDSFYSEIRNQSVHRLRGNDEQQVVSILGRDWPKQTIRVLKDHFKLDEMHSRFEQAIERFIEFLNRMFEEKYLTREGIGTVG